MEALPPSKGERAEARGLPAGGTLSEDGAAAANERLKWTVGRAGVERGILMVLHRLRRRVGHMAALDGRVGKLEEQVLTFGFAAKAENPVFFCVDLIRNKGIESMVWRHSVTCSGYACFTLPQNPILLLCL